MPVSKPHNVGSTEVRRCSTQEHRRRLEHRSSDFATAITSWADMYIHEYSGIDKVDPLDVSARRHGHGRCNEQWIGDNNERQRPHLWCRRVPGNVNQAGTGFTSRSIKFGNRTEDKNVTATGAVQRDSKAEWQCVGHAHGGVQGGPGYARHNASIDPNGPHCNAHIDLADQSDLERKHR